MQEPIFSQPVASLTAATTGTGTGIEVNQAGQRIVAYLIWSSGCSAGTVVLEGALDRTNTDTWQTIDTFAWTAASKEDIRSYDESYQVVRFRVTSNVVGGTITAKIQAYA